MEATKSLKSSAGNGASKIHSNKVERVDSYPKTKDRLREFLPETNKKIPLEKTYSFENLEFSDVRTDKRLFHTSTTELYEKKPLHRSSSFFSSSRSSLASGNFGTGTSSNITLSSTGSSGYGTLPRTPQNENPAPHWPEEKPLAAPAERPVERRNSSNTRFNEYIHSTSSWEWEDEEAPDVPELQDPFAYRKRRSSYRNSISEATDLISFDVPEEKDSPFPEVNPRRLPSEEQASAAAAIAASGCMRASCPTLNADDASARVLRKQQNSLKAKLAKNSQASASTYEIGKAKPSSERMASSKSSSCISSVRSISFLNTKRPITLRFTPSGLTETSRVVWMTESGDHTGTVKWVGKIRDQFYAGVEFEKPIGNSSGIYGYGYGLQIRLFTCKLGYGRFIPVDQLILYEDFYENQKTGFICIICRDDFIEPGETEDGLDVPEKIMVATKCGHLFHQICLTQWFNEKSAAFQNCPYCHFPMDRNDTIRIFPAQLK